MVLSGCRSSARIPPRLLALLLPYHQSGDEAATKRPATPSSLRTPSPDNAGPRAIGFKDEDIPGNMVPVQREHGVPETTLRLTIRSSRERIVYAATPTQFLKSGEHGDLITSRLAKPFDDQAANAKFAQLVIPGRLRSACRARFGAGLHAMPSNHSPRKSSDSASAASSLNSRLGDPQIDIETDYFDRIPEGVCSLLITCVVQALYGDACG